MRSPRWFQDADESWARSRGRLLRERSRHFWASCAEGITRSASSLASGSGSRRGGGHELDECGRPLISLPKLPKASRIRHDGGPFSVPDVSRDGKGLGHLELWLADGYLPCGDYMPFDGQEMLPRSRRCEPRPPRPIVQVEARGAQNCSRRSRVLESPHVKSRRTRVLRSDIMYIIGVIRRQVAGVALGPSCGPRRVPALGRSSVDGGHWSPPASSLFSPTALRR